MSRIYTKDELARMSIPQLQCIKHQLENEIWNSEPSSRRRLEAIENLENVLAAMKQNLPKYYGDPGGPF